MVFGWGVGLVSWVGGFGGEVGFDLRVLSIGMDAWSGGGWGVSGTGLVRDGEEPSSRSLEYMAAQLRVKRGDV